MFSKPVEMCADDSHGMSEIEEFPLCQLDANQMQTITESSLKNLLPHDYFSLFPLLLSLSLSRLLSFEFFLFLSAVSCSINA